MDTYGHLNFNTKFLPFSTIFPCFPTNQTLQRKKKKTQRVSTMYALQESQKLGNKNPIISLIRTRKSLKRGT